MKKVVRISVMCIIAIMIFGCFEPKTKQAVLLVEVTDEAGESFGISNFREALNSGGQVKITIDEITQEWSAFGKYAITKDGSYLIRGAVINFICQEYGWKFHGSELTSIMFVKEIEIRE